MRQSYPAIAALAALLVGCGSAEVAPDRPPGALFEEVAARVGVQFNHEASQGQYYIVEEMGPGGALLDADGDGDLDLYLVQGGRIPYTEIGTVAPNRFYRNLGDGTFRDETEASGAGDTGYGMGATAADVDNDGDTDIYVTNIGPDVLLINDGRGRFVDRTQAAGLGDAGFGAGASFADLDGDGLLDLYVTVYMPWSPDVEQPCRDANGVREYCNPTNYPTGQDRLYRNRGDGTFEDVTASSGIDDHPSFGLGAVTADFDGDGRIDIYVANDHQPNYLWINQGDLSFREEATERGCAYNATGQPEASMGIACEDVDLDGDLDLFVMHFSGETNTFYRNDSGFFVDETDTVGLAAHGFTDTTFGVGTFDLDNDGQPEMLLANGSVMRVDRPERPENQYALRNRLLRIGTDGRFTDITAEGGAAFDSVEMSRAALFGDYDNDGDVDLFICNNRGPFQLLRNNSDTGHHWLQVTLEGRSVNRAGLGAVITVTAGRRTLRRRASPHYGYLASNDPRTHFGLGAHSSPVDVTVDWPNGATERFAGVAIDQVVVLAEGAGVTEASETRSVEAPTSASSSLPAVAPATVTAPFPRGDAMSAEVNRRLQAGEREAALAAAREWLEVTLSEAGIDHPQVIDSVATIARLSADLGRTAEAEQALREGIDRYHDAGRGSHPGVARLAAELGALYAQSGKLSAAETQFKAAVDAGDRAYGPGSSQALSMRRLLAGFYFEIGRKQAAEATLLDAYERMVEVSGESELTADLVARAGRIALDDERPVDALRSLEKAAAAYESLLADHDKTGDTYSTLGDLYLDRRDFNRAISRLQRAADIRSRLDGRNSDKAMESIGRLGNAYGARGDLDQAESLILEALEYFRATRGADDLSTVGHERNLAVVYAGQERFVEAERLFSHALAIFERDLPPGHAVTEQVRRNLAYCRRALGE